MFDAGELLAGYDRSRLTVGSFGGRSALDIAAGARAQGFPTLVVAREGLKNIYVKEYKTRKRGVATVGCVDRTIVVEDFEDILQESIQQELRKMNTIFVHSKYFWRRFKDFQRVEEDFHVPIFGSRHLLRLEGKFQPYTEYELLSDAGISVPRRFQSPEEINCLAIVKVREDLRGYERAFFLAWDRESFEEEAARRMKRREITEEGLRKAVIEEYVVGTPVNFHFFFSPLSGELEFLGCDMRRQTNFDGFLRMTASQQKIAMAHVPVKMIDIGHVACTVRESLLEKVFAMAQEFIEVTESLPREADPTGKGIIGPFTFQSAIVAEEGREDIVTFDVCFRSTSCPGISATPYAAYLHGRPMSTGERIAMEIKGAVEQGRLEEIVT